MKMTVKQEKTTNKLKKYKDSLLLFKLNPQENRGKEKIIGEIVFPELPGSAVNNLLEFIVIINRISTEALILFNNNYRIISN